MPSRSSSGLNAGGRSPRTSIEGTGSHFGVQALCSSTVIEIFVLGWQLFLRDFRTRYRQAYLGYVWAFARIVLTGGPIIMVGNQFGLGEADPTVDYIPFAFAGTFFFQVFWDGLVMPQWIGRRMRVIMRDIPIPSSAVLVAAACYTGFNSLLSGIVLTVLLVVFDASIAATFPLILVSFPVVMLAGIAVGAFILPVTFVYLDIRYALTFIAPVVMFSTPIFYVSPETGFLATVNTWNPLTYLINTPRDWLFAGFTGDEPLFAAIIVFVFILLAIALLFLRRGLPIALEQLIRPQGSGEDPSPINDPLAHPAGR